MTVSTTNLLSKACVTGSEISENGLNVRSRIKPSLLAKTSQFDRLKLDDLCGGHAQSTGLESHAICFIFERLDPAARTTDWLMFIILQDISQMFATLSQCVRLDWDLFIL